MRPTSELATRGSITFMIRPGRVYPHTDSHESARYWSGGFFYLKDVSDPASERKLPPFKNCPASETPTWTQCPHLSESPELTRAVRRICKLTEEGLTGKDLTLSCSKLSRKVNSEPSSGSLLRATRIRRPHRRWKLMTLRALPRGRGLVPPALQQNAPAKCSALRLLGKAEAEKKRLKLIDTSNRGQPDIQQFFKPSGSGSQSPKAPRALKKKVKPSPASIPVTPEVEVPPKASSASKPDPKDVINIDDLPEDPAGHGDSGKGASSSAPPPDQPSATFVEPTTEEYEQKVQLIHASSTLQANPQPAPSLQKLSLAQRHAEVSAMMDKVWGTANTEMQELTDLENDLKTTWKLHEDLRVHVLEQITEIEGLRQNAENSQKAIQHLETRLREETAKRSSFDDLSAKVKVLEAENESLKTFIKESSDKENEARKELSEKHARDLAELNDKLKKSQQRVTSLVAKNKVQEAEAEAIESSSSRMEAYDEARSSIDALFAACRGFAKTLSLKRAKTTVIDTMTKLMEQVPEFIKDWQESSARGVASLVLATCKAHFPSLNFADVARGTPEGADMRAILSETKGFEQLFVRRVNHSFWYHKYDLPKGFSDAEEEEGEPKYYAEGSGSSVELSGEGSDDDSEAGSGDSDGDGSAYEESEEEDSE
ncbi:hypothetical protein QYE76_003417 [Lolium multiflorum]|uniref:Uncharacterized protein n=1 Tax=Lolium multiflorum TaxID=4521 RepID=A0AAD8VZ78_LOLMU|nr:hypothetical protein QYE76_003417 [Lolium multiflorum]